jgi:hypothetical protein
LHFAISDLYDPEFCQFCDEFVQLYVRELILEELIDGTPERFEFFWPGCLTFYQVGNNYINGIRDWLGVG